MNDTLQGVLAELAKGLGTKCGAVHDADYTNYYCWGCGAKVVDEC